MLRNPARYQPPALSPHWQPMAQPEAAPQQSVLAVLAPKILREVLIFSVLIALVAKVGAFATVWGWVAVGVARCLISFLGLRRIGHQPRSAIGRLTATLFEWAAVAALAAIVVAALVASPATSHKVKTPHLKAPVNVEASQTDYLDQAKEGVATLYEQIATGFSKAAVKPAKKEGR